MLTNLSKLAVCIFHFSVLCSASLIWVWMHMVSPHSQTVWFNRTSVSYFGTGLWFLAKSWDTVIITLPHVGFFSALPSFYFSNSLGVNKNMHLEAQTWILIKDYLGLSQLLCKGRKTCIYMCMCIYFLEILAI